MLFKQKLKLTVILVWNRSFNALIDWFVEQGLTSHQTQYTSYQGRVLQVKWPKPQCQSTEGSSGPKDQASIPPGPPHHVTILHMHAIYSQTQNNIYTKMNLSTVKWAKWDKTQSRELLGLFICVCSSLCTTVAHNSAQNRPDNFPSCPPDNQHCSDDVYLGERRVFNAFMWQDVIAQVYSLIRSTSSNHRPPHNLEKI